MLESEIEELKKKYKNTFYKKCQKNIPSIEEYEDVLYYTDISKCSLEHGFKWEDSYKRTIPANNIEVLKTIITYHSYGGFYGFFKPDLKEIYSQIANSVEDIKIVVGFRVVCLALNKSEDVHIAQTTIYKKLEL